MSSSPHRSGLGWNRPSQKSGGCLAPIIGTVVLFSGFSLVLYFFGFLKLPGWGGANLPQAGAEVGAEAAAGPPGKNVEQVTTASIHKQQLALAKVNQKQLVSTYEQLKRTHDEWEKALTEWEQEGPALLKNEAGKKIAADKAQVARFRGLSRVTRPSRDQLATARQAAEDLVRPIRESLANPEDASNPDSSLTSSLEKLATDATQARDSYRQSMNAVRAMLAQVKDTAPAEQTLEEALATLDQEQDAQRVAAIDAEEKKAKDEAAKKVAAEKVKLTEAKAEAEARRIQDEAAKTKQAADLAAARTIEEMKLKQKEADQRIAQLEAQKEQQRQGDLKAGSVWKGSMRDQQGFNFDATMRIDSRVKDDITGSVTATSGEAGRRGLTFKGKVSGTTLKLTPVTGGPASDVQTCVYNPAAKTISGGGTYQTYNLKLSEEKDE